MEKSKAIILTYSPEPKKTCAAAARISTTLGTATEIYEKTNDDNIGNLISKVLSSGHKSFIEHAYFTIAFENVSVFLEEFIIEFRLASFTVKSRRYVDFSNMGYYQPEFRFSKNVAENKKEKLLREYNNHMNYLFSEYSYFVQNGIPKEDARFILPYSYRSNFYCSVNARELLHIIYSAIYGRGRRFPEIKNIGKSLLEQAKSIFPDVFDLLETVESGSEDKEERLRKLFEQKLIKEKATTHLTELISYTKEPEEIVVISAIASNTGCKTYMAKEIIAKDRNIFDEVLKIIMRDRRKRELEQANFTFRINGISLAGLTHIVRHRIHSIIVPSFTEFGKSEEYSIPDTIRGTKGYLERYNEVWRRNKAAFNDFREIGVLKEDLVYLYLSGNVLDIITTMNGRELYHFIQLRSCNRAQWEIRNIAIDMLKKLRKVAPKLFAEYGPACFMTGKCPEGKYSCGRMDEIREFFGGNLE